MSKHRGPRTAAFGASLLVSIAASAFAESDDVTKMAEEVARLRSEVETLNTKLLDDREAQLARLRSIAGQKASLEAELQREELRIEQLERSLERVKKDAEASGALEAALRPRVLTTIDEIREQVRAGLPFRVEDRVADLDQLKKDIEAGVVPASVAVARLSSRVEDELRLARENGLYQQVIRVGGEDVLADVARVGMVMLFFRTPDERYGRAIRAKGTWRFETYQDEAQREQLATWFDALEKRVRVGFFELPNGLTGQEAAQ